MSGEMVTVDGTSGTIYRSCLPMVTDVNDQNFRVLRNWAYRYKKLDILAAVSDGDCLNCNWLCQYYSIVLQENVNVALNLGAEGIGLWGAHRVFLHEDTLHILQKLVLSPPHACKEDLLSKLFEVTEASYMQPFQMLQGRVACTRLYDPTLADLFPSLGHPTFAADINFLCGPEQLNLNYDLSMSGVMDLNEQFPPHSLMGSKLLHSYAEFADAQIRGIFAAACRVMVSAQVCVDLQLILPWFTLDDGIPAFISRIRKLADEKFLEHNCRINYKIGFMIEAPRQCLRLHDVLSKNKFDFVMFDTNVLTSMAFGYGTMEAPKYLHFHADPFLIPHKNPFRSIDEKGVGLLIRNAAVRCRNLCPKMKIGVYGAHTSDPTSVQFFNNLEVDYLCVESSRVSVAVVAAAQANIRTTTNHAKDAKRFDSRNMLWPTYAGRYLV